MGQIIRNLCPIRGNSELARVAYAFNTMADALEHREHELSEAKETAEEAAARITMIFESTTDGVLIVDWNWRIGNVHGPASAQLAEDRDVIGMTLSEAFPHDAEIFPRFQAAMSEQRPASFEAFCERRSIWYALNAFPASQGKDVVK